jgi:hypothetical protein
MPGSTLTTRSPLTAKPSASHPLLIDNALLWMDGWWLTATDMLSRGDPLADIFSLSLCTLGADNYAHDDATSLRSSFCAVDV